MRKMFALYSPQWPGNKTQLTFVGNFFNKIPFYSFFPPFLEGYDSIHCMTLPGSGHCIDSLVELL